MFPLSFDCEEILRYVEASGGRDWLCEPAPSVRSFGPFPRRLSAMTIGSDGAVIWCNSSSCRAHLTIPAALIDEPAENKRRWSSEENWTTDLVKGLDWCSRHPQSAAVARTGN